MTPGAAEESHTVLRAGARCEPRAGACAGRRAPDAARPVPPLRAIEGSMAAYWVSLAQSVGGAVERAPGLTWTYTGTPVLNRVVETHCPDDEIDAAIARLTEHYRALGASFAWLVGPSASPPDLAERLERQGFESADSLSGMALELSPALDLDEPPLPAQPRAQSSARHTHGPLIIRPVEDEATWRDWLSVVQDAFGLPDAAREVFDSLPHTSAAGALPADGFGSATWRRYVGYHDGRPVSTASLVAAGNIDLVAGTATPAPTSTVVTTGAVGGAVGIYLVGTTHGSEGEGLASSLTRHALREARAAGYRVAVLQATPAAESLYRKMGFEEHCRIRVYRWSPPGSLLRRVAGAARRGWSHATSLVGLASLSFLPGNVSTDT